MEDNNQQQVEEPKTALKYDGEKLPWHLLPVRATEGMLRGLAYGARKYTVCGDCKAKIYPKEQARLVDKGGAPERNDCPECKSKNLVSGENNWRKGFNWTRLLGAAFRHLSAILRGEDTDPESLELHSSHLMCCAAFIAEHMMETMGTDDRYKNV